MRRSVSSCPSRAINSVADEATSEGSRRNTCPPLPSDTCTIDGSGRPTHGQPGRVLRLLLLRREQPRSKPDRCSDHDHEARRREGTKPTRSTRSSWNRAPSRSLSGSSVTVSQATCVTGATTSLRDPHAAIDGDGRPSEIDQRDLHLAAVVGVDRARCVHDGQAMFGGQARPRPHLRLVALGYGHRKPAAHQRNRSRLNHHRRAHCGVQVHGRRVRRLIGGQRACRRRGGDAGSERSTIIMVTVRAHARATSPSRPPAVAVARTLATVLERS